MSRTLDTLDKRIVEELRENARASNRTIAADLDVSEATVRGRIRRMLDDRLIRIQAVTNIEALHRPVFAFVWIEVERGRVEEIAETLCGFEEIRYVARLMGRADLLAMALVESAGELAELVRERIARIAGVRRAEPQQVLRTVKHDYRLARLVQPPTSTP